MTAVSISGLRQALATNLGTITGLRTAAEIPDNPSPPIAVVTVDGIDYDQAFKQGLTIYNFTVLVIVGRASEREAQRRLDAYAQTDGVKSAIESDRSLGGLAYDTRVVNLSTIGSLQLNDQTYLVAEFSVSVFA
jgi:hypothetical protein